MNPVGLGQQLTEAGATGGLSAPMQIALFLGGMAFLTSALVTLTAFTRIVIVLSFIRRALATQEIPPPRCCWGCRCF